jgi:hypothetical protein
MSCFIDGDFPTKRQCKYHCSPTCHPAQISPKWVYGCTHPSWPQNKAHDFVPIVKCGGRYKKCELKNPLAVDEANPVRRAPHDTRQTNQGAESK